MDTIPTLRRLMRLSPLYVKPPAPTVFYTLSLHDALPIYFPSVEPPLQQFDQQRRLPLPQPVAQRAGVRCKDRKSTRLNSSHLGISYAVFCLKKKIEP